MNALIFIKKVFPLLIPIISSPIFGQGNILFDNQDQIIPDGIIIDESHDNIINCNFSTNSVKSKDSSSVIYKYGKEEHYTKQEENDDWNLYKTTLLDYNDFGILTKTYDVDNHLYTAENNYDLYYYDEHNRPNKIEYYFDDGVNGLIVTGFRNIKYLNDFPNIDSSNIYYTREVEYDIETNDWKYVWQIYSGTKRDYTISKKVQNHYEKKVDYTYNYTTKQWNVSGYKYDYVVNHKGLITETLVYQATNENEDKWPLVLHVKNLINDNGVVFRSDRINYRASTPYITRWSNIKWDKHDGSMPISGYPVQGDNRIKEATIEYYLVSEPYIEYAPSCTFSSEYKNNESFHYIVKYNSGEQIIDNSFYREANYSLQEIWQEDSYQMQYYEIDDHNWITYDHNVVKLLYEGDNIITQRDWHRYTNNEYYKNTNELTISEHYEYDALTDTEPFGRDRFVYSDYKIFSSGINAIEQDGSNQAPVYYNLHGILISNPESGQLLIRKIGNKTDKIIYRNS